MSLLLSKFSFMQFFSVYDLYYQWETAGVFDFVLPMLLIFAVVFGILTSTGVLGHNRGVNLLIALVIAIMAMRLEIVSVFFSVIFPGLGIGIAVLITVLILAGLFMNNSNFRHWLPTFFWGGLIIGLIIVVVSLNELAWFGSPWWQQNWVSILWIVILFAILAPIFTDKKTDTEKGWENQMLAIPMGPLRAGAAGYPHATGGRS